MSLGAVLNFFREHPDLLRLVQGFPKLSGDTGRLLLRFLERALRDKNPDQFLRDSLTAALEKAQTTKVEVLSVKPRR